ncbi:MAG: pyrroline-5-carboxylate reductase [Chloroflexi bacterium]|nr:pyrroline-5-carboxylate reductase [Chloroflexota bacterium]
MVIERIGFIGGGVMAEAIVRGLLDKQVVKPGQVMASDPLEGRRSWLASQYRIQTTADNWLTASGVSVVVLAVKPQQIAEVLAGLRGLLHADQLVLSIVAGVPIHIIAEGLAHDRIVRVMPNTPAQIGAGMSVWTATSAVCDVQRDHARTILRAIGREVCVHDEKYLDMATAINGSGPAYVFLFLEALVDAAVHIGLARPVAEDLVLQTALGSVLMARESGKHLAELKNMVTSPAGTTAEALLALEDGRLRGVIDRAVVAAYERSKALGK